LYNRFVYGFARLEHYNINKTVLIFLDDLLVFSLAFYIPYMAITRQFCFLSKFYCSPKDEIMRNITFEKLRRIKHALPEGSIAQIANDLSVDEQTVRNYFGAHNYKDGVLVEFYREQGPQGGIVQLSDDTILNRALQILGEKTVS
jgi:hypothetical protein